MPDVAGHLFGRDPHGPRGRSVVRSWTLSARTASTAISIFSLVMDPVDHVLPWSLVGIDGLANLVLACRRCNGDKSNALPAVSIVDRVLDRDRIVLEQIADEIRWPTEHKRVVSRQRGESTAGSRRVCRHGLATKRVHGWISPSSPSRRGGLRHSR